MTNRFLMALIAGALLATGPACQRSIGQVEPEEGSCPIINLLPESPDLVGLEDDIRLLAMLNRLQLTPEQIHQLLPVSEALQGQRTTAQAEVEVLQADLRTALLQKRQLLLGDRPVPEQLNQRIQRAQVLVEAAREQAAGRLGQAAKAVRALLSPEQLAIVTGRYEGSLQAQELLDWLRGLSDTEFADEAAANAEGLENPDLGFTSDALEAMFVEVRKLSAAQYEAQRATYAAKLAPLYGVTEDEENQRIAGAFSHAHMPGLLREKLQVLGEGTG